MELEPIIVDEQVSDENMIGSLKVIHTPGHTPGHISLYYEEDRILFGADTITSVYLEQRVVCTLLLLWYQ